MAVYQIRVAGYLDLRWSAWFEGLSLSHTEQGETILCGSVADQAALYGLLIKVRDLGLPLLEVNCIASAPPAAGALDCETEEG